MYLFYLGGGGLVGNLQTVFDVHFTFIAVSSTVGATDWEVDKGTNQAAVGVHGRGI